MQSSRASIIGRLFAASVTGAMLVGVAVVGCRQGGVDPPSAAVAQAGYTQLWLDQDLQRVVSFKPIKGVMGQNDGVKTYEMQFEAEFECLQEWTIERAMRVFQCEPGKRIAHAGALEFELTDSGWQAR